MTPDPAAPAPGAEEDNKPMLCECGLPLPVVPFDSDKVRGLTPREVRQLFPRLNHTCECGHRTIMYASYEHYLAGDY